MRAKHRVWISWRMFVVVTTFFGMILHALMRNIIGVTMLCMVNATAIAFNENRLQDNLIFNNLSTRLYNSSVQDKIIEECVPTEYVKDDYHHGQFTWSSNQQSNIFAANAWGQLITFVPAGIYADKYSSCRLLLISTIIGGLCTFLLPLLAHWGVSYVIGLRVLVGMTTGMAWPCINTVTERWVPSHEKGVMYGFVTCGRQLAIVIMMPLSAVFCKQFGLFGGWPFNYYSVGVLSLVWCLIWGALIRDYPEQHPYISADEVEYINAGRKQVDKRARKRLKTPYRQILFSPPCLALTLCQMSANWGITCLVLYLPMYFRDVMYMDLYSNGELSALPFLSQMICKLLFCRLAEILEARKLISPDLSIKLFNLLAFLGISCFLIGATFLNCTQTVLAVALICMATGLFSANGAGYLVGQLLVAPNFTGTLTAVMNFAATTSQLIVPYMVGALVVEATASEWRLVFGAGAAAQIISGFVFLRYGTAHEQPWAKLPDEPIVLKDDTPRDNPCELVSINESVKETNESQLDVNDEVANVLKI